MNNPSVTAIRGRAAQTHAALLDAAERLLAVAGMDAMTSTAVAAEAGVSTGSFYGHFPDKHALLAELFAGRLDAVVDAVEAVLSADRLLDDGLDATLAEAVAVVVAGYRRHTAVLRTALGRVAVRPELRTIYWDRYQRALAVIERFVRRAVTAGMAEVADARVSAHVLLVLTEGLHHPVLLGEDEALAAAVAEEAGRVLASALRPR